MTTKKTKGATGSDAGRMDRATIQALPEREKNRLRAETLALLEKAESGNETELERARLRELVRCGMAPDGPQPPQGVRPERKPALREHARERAEAFKRRQPWEPVWLNNEAEHHYMMAEFNRMIGNANSEVAEAFRAQRDDALCGRDRLVRVLIGRTLAIYEKAEREEKTATDEAQALSDADAELLSLLITPAGQTKERDSRKRRDKYLSYKEIAESIGVSQMAIHRRADKLKDKLRDHPRLAGMLAASQSRRIPRGKRKTTVIKSRKITPPRTT